MIQSKMIKSTLYIMDKKGIRAERLNRGILDCFGIYYCRKKLFILFYKKMLCLNISIRHCQMKANKLICRSVQSIRTRHIFLAINYNFECNF